MKFGQVMENKRAMLRALGGGQIKKKYINTAAANFKALKKIIINENFLAHCTEGNSVRATISKICAKIIKI